MVSAMLAAAIVQSPASDPVLLALTPVFDGRIVTEEWLPFVDEGGFKGYLQWEPGSLHFAASLPVGRDVVLSIDPAADGWLNGTDNREVRVTWSDGQASCTVRSLDTKERTGPQWRDAETASVRVLGTSIGDRWTVEGTFRLGRSARDGGAVGALLSSIGSTEDSGQAYLPRPLSYVRFGFDGSVGLPSHVTWKSDARLREVAREDGVTMEFVIHGENQYSTAVVRGEGFARDDLSIVSRSLPSSGQRGTSAFEYKSKIGADATPGWRIIQASLGDAVLRTSIKIAELVEVDIDLPETVLYSATDRSIKGRVDVRSTGVGRIEGQYDVVVDPGWTVKRGGAQRVMIYNPRGRERINLDFLVPGGSQGEFPVTFTVTVGSQTFTRTAFVTVAAP
jgi:hypothetical protein